MTLIGDAPNGQIKNYMAKEIVVLCVDDEGAILRALTRSLRLEKFRVLIALNGYDGLKILENEPVSVIISDQRMPGMTGIELLREVKNKYPDVTRIMLSGFSDFDDLAGVLREKVIHRFFCKPWDDKELKDYIHKVSDVKNE